MSSVKPRIQALLLLVLTFCFTTGLAGTAVAGLASSPLGIVAPDAPRVGLTTMVVPH